jgi:IS30 family transposase
MNKKIYPKLCTTQEHYLHIAKLVNSGMSREDIQFKLGVCESTIQNAMKYYRYTQRMNSTTVHIRKLFEVLDETVTHSQTVEDIINELSSIDITYMTSGERQLFISVLKYLSRVNFNNFIQVDKPLEVSACYQHSQVQILSNS